MGPFVTSKDSKTPPDHVYSSSALEPRRSSQKAMPDELDVLKKTHTWDLVNLPIGKTAVACK